MYFFAVKEVNNPNWRGFSKYAKKLLWPKLNVDRAKTN